MGLSWGEALAAAKDKTMWKNIVGVALCLTGDEEDKYVSKLPKCVVLQPTLRPVWS